MIVCESGPWLSTNDTLLFKHSNLAGKIPKGCSLTEAIKEYSYSYRHWKYNPVWPIYKTFKNFNAKHSALSVSVVSGGLQCSPQLRPSEHIINTNSAEFLKIKLAVSMKTGKKHMLKIDIKVMPGCQHTCAYVWEHWMPSHLSNL